MGYKHVKVVDGKKKCAGCDQLLSVDNFYPRPRAKSKYHSRCIPCINFYNNLTASQKNKHSIRTIESRAVRYLFRTARDRAKKLNIEFTISDSDIKPAYKCPVLGIDISPMNEKGREYSWSLDRVDINKGYIPGNVAIISTKANRMKNDNTIESLKQIMNYMNQFVQDV